MIDHISCAYGINLDQVKINFIGWDVGKTLFYAIKRARKTKEIVSSLSLQKFTGQNIRLTHIRLPHKFIWKKNLRGTEGGACIFVCLLIDEYMHSNDE